MNYTLSVFMNDIPERIRSLMSACVECGACLDVCPSHRYGGVNPMEAMIGGNGNVTSCIGCLNCSNACNVTDPSRVIMYLNCIESGAKIPDLFYDTGYSIKQTEQLSRTELPPKWNGNDIYLMPGCFVEGKFPFLKYATSVVMNAVGIGCCEIPNSKCCMFPVPFRIMTDEERDDYKEKMNPNDGKDIVTLCPGCAAELEETGMDAKHVVQLLHSHLDSISKFKGVKLKVALQPGCHIMIHYPKEFEDLVRATGATLIGNRIGCCGKSVKDISEKLMKERQEDIKDADAVITGCPSCMFRYDNVKDGVPVLHIIELLALATGDSSTQKYHKLKLKDI